MLFLMDFFADNFMDLLMDLLTFLMLYLVQGVLPGLILFIICICFFFVCSIACMDASHPWQIGFQDPATPIMEGIIFFNGFLMAFMIFIACLVGWLLYKSLSLFDESVHADSVAFTHSTLLEVVWTIIPAVILMAISIPSYNLLYAMDEVIDPSLSIKIVGHQWYWSYECSDFEVSPKLQEESTTLVNDVHTTLRDWTDYLENWNIEASTGEKQTRITLAKDLLDFLDNNLTDLSPHRSLAVGSRINLINGLIVQSELVKESHGPLDRFESGEMVDIISSVKAKLKTSSLIPEQQEAVIQILMIFKQYLRIVENTIPLEELKEIKSDIDKNLDLDNDSLIAFVNPADDSDDKPAGGSDDKPAGDSDDKPAGDSDDKPTDEPTDNLIVTDSDNCDSVVTDLKFFDNSVKFWKWCELLATKQKYNLDIGELEEAAYNAFLVVRACNKAASALEDDNVPFSENIEKMKRTSWRLKELKPVADLSESRLIDTQLTEHQLRLTRFERESLSSEYAWKKALFMSDRAKFDFNNALDELNNAKLHLHWSKIDASAANVNRLTAAYLQADASLGVTDPLLIRSLWINEKGYYSWTKYLRLAIKKLSEIERLIALNVEEELSSANSRLNKAQKALTLEECARSNSIANNAKAEFLAMEKEVIPAIDEFTRGQVILENAKNEFKTYQEILGRADVRLNRAQTAFDEVQAVSNRTQSILNAAEALYKSAQAKLAGSKIVTRPVLNKSDLDFAELKFESFTKEFNKVILDVESAKSDLIIAKERIKLMNSLFKKTKDLFEDTGLLAIQTPSPGKPKEYYPNLLWEVYREDLAFVTAELNTDETNLELAKLSLNDSNDELSKIGGELLEAELVTNKTLVKYLSNLDDNEINCKILDQIKKQVAGIELNIAEAIYSKASENFELTGSDVSQRLLSRAEKGLSDAKFNSISGYLGSVLDHSFSNIDSEKVILDYAEKCLICAEKELKDAEIDYAKTDVLLAEAKSLLEDVNQSLNEDYDNFYLETLRSLYKKTALSLKERIEQFNLTKAEFSPLDIKLNPNVLQSRSYKEVLLAKAELANIKWLCGRVAKTLDIPLSEEVKPFNVQFSYLKSEESPVLVEGDSSNKPIDGSDDKSAGGSDDKSISGSDDKPISGSDDKPTGGSDDKPVDDSNDKKGSKSVAEIKEILSELQDRKVSYTPLGFQNEILQIFSALLKTVDEIEAKNTFNILRGGLISIAVEEAEKIKEIKDLMEFIKKELIDPVDINHKERQFINFDSYLIAEDDLVIPEAFGTGKAGKVFRLLEVDNRLFVPTNTHIRMLITSADVLHSWAVPSLGVKVDACPGRLNQVFLFVKREGVFYGQCSELCGVNHGFMPIVVQAVNQDEYLTWVGKRLCS